VWIAIVAVAVIMGIVDVAKYVIQKLKAQRH
jgi:hypothetical protein